MYASGKPGGATNLSDLSDVNVPAPNDNDHMVYDNGSSLWLPEAAAGGGETFVDRGDPAGYDWDQTSGLVATGWNELDMSSVVPAAAAGKLVLLYMTMTDANLGREFKIRPLGNVNQGNVVALSVSIANQAVLKTSELVLVDANRKVEYYTDAVTIRAIIVRGWWI